MNYLGIDTSNYTTSLALFDSSDFSVIQAKKLLPVKKGEKGLRQSDAVFHHTIQLPELYDELFSCKKEICAVGASDRPRNIEGSYMPCFKVGCLSGRSISKAASLPFYTFSHQQGHIAAALYSCGRTDLLKENFIAFHVSGGTTEALLVTPDEKNIFKCEIIGCSNDLKAGQAIDRTGVMLGLDFPSGKEIDALSMKSQKEYKIHPSVKDGVCSLSGVENQVKRMYEKGESKEDISKYCLSFICSSLDKMTQYALEKYGQLPVLYAGGVMSNTYIRSVLREKYNGMFAKSEFSSDNACGIAYLCYYKENML